MDRKQMGQAVLAVCQTIYDTYLEERGESADRIADQINHLLREEEIGDKILSLSFCLAKAVEALAEETAHKVPHNLKGILISEREHRYLIENACLAAAGKLIAHFTNPRYEYDM